jgi:methylenetetrahydrofolate dehydrogenase (NADP+)/methenyltetrahydrofolate cyclohydrolase
MSKLLYGKPIIDELTGTLSERATALTRSGISPCLAVVRVGERSDDIAYENAIAHRAGSVGITLRRERIITGQKGANKKSTAENNESLQSLLNALASDASVHGVLLFRPLPDGMDEGAALAAIPADKDVDGVTQAQMAALYGMKSYGSIDDVFFPCTAEAVIRMLDYYGIPICGKRVVVVGRSTVIGKPAAHLLLARDATVTVCHSRTMDLADMTRGADIVVASAGLARESRAHRLGAAYFAPGQTVIDVAVNADAEGLYGDADTDAVLGAIGHDDGIKREDGPPASGDNKAAGGITPVPGGLGAVTTLVLMEHVIRAAEMSSDNGSEGAQALDA